MDLGREGRGDYVALTSSRVPESLAGGQGLESFGEKWM